MCVAAEEKFYLGKGNGTLLQTVGPQWFVLVCLLSPRLWSAMRIKISHNYRLRVECGHAQH